MVCDAQTSGGLLISLNKLDAKILLNEMQEEGITNAAIIGEFTSEGAGMITVEK
jgi:selenide,water dikinase